MAEHERETVVVEGDRSPSYGWLVALIVIALLVIAFFAFGGMNALSGAADTGTPDTINVTAPDTIQVEPGTQ